MLDPIAFALAAFTLLLTPGPTNALLATSGAMVGVCRSLRLIPAEVGGYMAAILAYLAIFGPDIGANPAIAAALKAGAALWLAFSAVRIWRSASHALALNDDPVGVWRLFVTTLLNPKAMIFAFVILPPGAPARIAPALAGLAALIALAGTCWISFGAFLSASQDGRLAPRRILQTAAVVLGVFASVLAGSAIAAAF